MLLASDEEAPCYCPNRPPNLRGSAARARAASQPPCPEQPLRGYARSRAPVRHVHAVLQSVLQSSMVPARRTDVVAQCIVVPRLGIEPVQRPAVHSVEHPARFRAGRQDDAQRVGIQIPHPLEELSPVDQRCLTAADDHLHVMQRQQLERVRSRERRHDVVAVLLEQGFECRQRRLVVVDEQHRRARCMSRASSYTGSDVPLRSSSSSSRTGSARLK